MYPGVTLLMGASRKPSELAFYLAQLIKDISPVFFSLGLHRVYL